MIGAELFGKMKTLLAFVDSGIIISDSSHYNIVYANPSALKFFGKEIEDLLGTPVSGLFSKENWEKISVSMGKVKQSKVTMKIHLEEKGGFLKLSISPIMVGEKYTGFILNILDTTVEEHLLIQRSELTSMMITELKDPIYTLYDLFHNKQAHKTENGYIDQAKESTKLLMNALETLLDINQLTTGVLNLELEATDALKVIKSCIKSVEPFARKQGVLLYSTYKCINSIVKLDREKFAKGLINLFILAIKESHEKDILYIEVSNNDAGDNAHLTLIVANTGMGVAESIFENVNDNQPFSHLKNGEKLNVEVLTAKRVIQAHSGRMQVTSEFGIGSCFTVTLPITEG